MPPQIFISTLWNGISRATLEPGGEWHVEMLLDDKQVRCISTDRFNPWRIFAGTQGEGVLRSDDGGQTWQPSGLGGHIVKAIAVSPTEPDVIYAGTKPAYLFVSRDGGQAWAELESFRHIRGRWFWLSPAEKPFTAYVQGIALSPTDPQRMAIGIEAGATVMTRDGGQTWTRHRKGSLRDCHSLIFHSTNGQWLYEGGGSGGGASFSSDAGRTWSQPKQGLDRHYGWAVAADPVDPGIWYVSLSPGAFKAHSDGNAQAYIFRREGDNWKRLSGGLPQPLNHMPYALLTDPAEPGNVYAGLGNGDIWHSPDQGDTWQQLPLKLSGIERTLVML